ncbi:NAD(P)/FAD-dependent oxidoreductase [Govanella unica]|uniref:FAD-binding oxidoreductase n=1 Tax=Govanella unica TaxID=2975056 RepID=A0A9X3TWX2_9PROT|nr:FAD-dependent oxidoreductase [Govania unica]MDA5193461.1 FAD-binding oxidoreductase [Govania unica]
MTQHNVLIIGGGLVGCATAYYLAKAGASVVLAEQGQLNRQASGQNAGSLHFQLEHRLIEHGDRQTEQFAQVIPLNLLAMKHWAGLEAELGEDIEIVMKGGLMVAETDSEVALLKKKFALEAQWGLPTQLLTGDEARVIAPYLSKSIQAAGYCDQEGHGNPRLVTLALARGAQRHGADIRTESKILAIKRAGAGWQVDIKGPNDVVETLEVSAVVNAAGAWAGNIARMVDIHLPVFAVPLSMNITDSGPAVIGHLIQHAGRKLSMKQVHGGNILIGGGWPSQFQHDAGVITTERRPELVEQNIIENLKVAADIIPMVRNRYLLRSWTGIVGITTDQLPILGEVPEAPGFFVATGGSGFTLGPTYGYLMSELILSGRTSCKIDAYSPARFRHINMFMGQGNR